MNENPIVINAYIPELRKELEDLYIEILNEKNWLCDYIEEFYGDIEKNYKIKFLIENPEYNKV